MTGTTGSRTASLMNVKAQNLLSFGPSGIDLELSNLNVVIGPNGSGKSNLFEVFRLLQAAPQDLSDPVRTGGGISEWIWKGQPKSSARVETVVQNPDGHQNLRHVIEFRESGRRFTLEDERVENEYPYDNQLDPYFFYRYQSGRPMLNVIGDHRRDLQPEAVESDRSILSQRKDPEHYPELSHLSGFYESVNLYNSWEFGRGAGIP